MELQGELRCHDWGKVGTNSHAGLFYWNSRKRNLLDKKETYSTVKLSAMPTSGTMFTKNREQLFSFIERQPHCLGAKCAKLFDSQLPFQIKLISLQKSMSLACHPNKVQSERLHKAHPNRYLDADHKSKMVISLSYLEVLVGFRPREEIVQFLLSVPELAVIIPYDRIEDYIYNGKKKHFKEVFYYLVGATPLESKLSLDIFFKRLSTADNATKSAVNFTLLERLQQQHPYDSGVYSPFFLNHIILNPGQALYIPPGVPHTYITGDCFEVSSRSFNVIRCGLTVKYKDILELLKVADFTGSTVDRFLLEPAVVDVFLTAYIPQVQEFGVNRICVPRELSYTLPVYESCSMAVVTRGSAVLEDFRAIKLGTTLFVLPYEKITFKVKRDITVYSVFPNVDAAVGDFATLL